MTATSSDIRCKFDQIFYIFGVILMVIWLELWSVLFLGLDFMKFDFWFLKIKWEGEKNVHLLYYLLFLCVNIPNVISKCYILCYFNVICPMLIFCFISMCYFDVCFFPCYFFCNLSCYFNMLFRHVISVCYFNVFIKRIFFPWYFILTYYFLYYFNVLFWFDFSTIYFDVLYRCVISTR